MAGNIDSSVPPLSGGFGTRPGAIARPLFGRDAELRILRRILNRGASGRGATVLISGESGAGKSVLLDKLILEARSEGFRIANARCMPAHVEGHESPWARVVDVCLRDPALPPGTSDSAGPRAADFPVVAELPPLQNGAFQLSLAESGAFQKVRDTLVASARSAPLLVALDDIRHADEISLGLIEYLGHGLRDLPILLVGTCRAYDPVDAPRQAMIDGIRRHAHNLELAPLGSRAVAALLESMLRHPVDTRLTERVHELSGGNPRLVVESEPMLSDGGATLTSSLELSTIPLGISIAVKERLEHLPSTAKQLLECAAAVGCEFDPDLGATIAEMDREAAQTAYHELEARGLLRPDARAHYQFAQGFVREVLYRELDASRRSTLHRRISQTLEAMHANAIEPHAEAIAQNLLRSREAPAIADAMSYAEMAGRRFMRVGAFAKASAVFMLALKAAELHGVEDDLRLCEILTQASIAQQEQGHLGAAEETFQRAVRIAQRIGDPARLARLALQAPDYHWPLPGCGSPMARLLAENALVSLGAGEPGLRAMLTARLAAELSYDRTQQRLGEELARRSIESAREGGAEAAVMMQVLRYRDCTLRHPDRNVERLANASLMMELGRQLSDMRAIHEAATAIVAAHLAAGRIGEAERAFQTFEQTASLVSRPIYRIYSQISAASRAVMMGRLAESEDLFERCRQDAAEAGVLAAAERCWPVMIVPMMERGRLADLEPLATASLRIRFNSPVERALKCWLDASLGRGFEARLRLERLAIDDFADLRHEADFLTGAAALGEACIRLDQDARGHAARIYELLLPYAELEISLGQIAFFGSVSYHLGRLANFLSYHDAAADHLQRAIERHLRSGSVVWSLYSAFEHARLLMAADDPGQRRAAHAALIRLEAEARSRDMQLLARQAQELRDAAPDARSGSDLMADHESPAAAGELNGRWPVTNGHTIDAAVPDLRERGVEMPGDARVFCREDEFWTLAYKGRIARVRHRKGLLLIAHLLARPGQTVHVTELAGILDAGNLSPVGTASIDLAGLGPVLDHGAKQAYRERARELREDLEEAQRFNDRGRVEKIEAELRFLTRELAQAIGLFGRDRVMGSSNERARLRITSAIRTAIAGLAPHHPALARHLDRTIRTGSLCAYRPEDEEHLAWRL